MHVKIYKTLAFPKNHRFPFPFQFWGSNSESYKAMKASLNSMKMNA